VVRIVAPPSALPALLLFIVSYHLFAFGLTALLLGLATCGETPR
jgi:hypothetical protein